MQLSNRLRTLADMVSKGSSVADVGCDHAYVSIYLMKEQIARKVIAMDINKGPLIRAKENIEEHHLSHHIEIRLSDGLQKLAPGEVDTILIAGMGGALTVRILSAREDVLSQVKEMVLSPHSEIFLVRQYLREHGFTITEENMVKEDGKYYMMVKAKREEETLWQEKVTDKHKQKLFDWYGKYLLEHKNPVLNEFLHVELRKRENIKKQLQSRPEEYKQRLLELEDDIKILKGGLQYYDM